MRRGDTLGVGAAGAALVFGGLPVGGAAGRVVDPEESTVADGRICYVAAGAGETFCDRTAADGRYVLPGDSVPSVPTVVRKLVALAPVREGAQP